MKIGSLVECKDFGRGIILERMDSCFVVGWYDEKMKVHKEIITRCNMFPFRWKNTFGQTVSMLSEGG
jgi:hypothetical protein